MNKIIINESLLKKMIKLFEEDNNDYDDYEDDTYYDSYQYKDVIEKYLTHITDFFSDTSCYVEEDDGKYYLDFVDFKIFFNLDSDSGILYVNNISMYDRNDAKEAFAMNILIIRVLTIINENPLNVSQKLE